MSAVSRGDRLACGYTVGMAKTVGKTHRAPDARAAVCQIVRLLQRHGHIAYLAGGCVRDRLRGVTPKDYDVATDAMPQVVRKLFNRSRFVGEAFGVVIVFMKGARVEVATFRTEWGYQDGRRPTHVEFSDAEHDARRRDFTINGLFEDPIAERVIDYVGGRADLKAGVIRAIGDAHQRFGEDYLRMLRAVRFAAELGFTIHRSTAAAIRRYAPQITSISRERTGQEVQLMLTGRQPSQAAALLQRLQLDGPVLDETHRPTRLSTLRRLNADAPYGAVLAAWSLDRHLLPRLAAKQSGVENLARCVSVFLTDGLADLVRRWRRALCLANDDRDALRACFKLLPAVLAWRDQSKARRKRLLADPAWPAAYRLVGALRVAGIAPLRRKIDQDALCLRAQGVNPRPLVTGDDLIRIGRKPGPTFSRLLNQVYDAQLEGRLRTRDQAIKWLKQL